MQQEFYSRKDLATIFGYSVDTVRRSEQHMRALIPQGVYSITDFSGTHIRRDAFQHYRNNKALLQTNPKYVEPFSARRLGK